MLISGNVGALGPNSDGAQQVPARMDRLGAVYVVEGRARYAENTRRGLRFQAANQAAVTTSVGLATTYTGLLVYNPIGSTVNLEIDKVGWSTIVAFTAAAAIGIFVGSNGGTAVSAVTVDGLASAIGNGAVGQGVAYKAATLPTAPTLRKVLATCLTGAITTVPSIAATIVDLEGSIVLTPGSYAGFYTSTASGASGFFGSMEWTEVQP